MRIVNYHPDVSESVFTACKTASFKAELTGHTCYFAFNGIDLESHPGQPWEHAFDYYWRRKRVLYEKARLEAGKCSIADVERTREIADLRETIARKDAEIEHLREMLMGSVGGAENPDRRLADQSRLIADQRATINGYKRQIERLSGLLSGRDEIIKSQDNRIAAKNATIERYEKLRLHSERVFDDYRRERINDIQVLQNELTRLRAQPQGAGARFAVGQRVVRRCHVSTEAGTIKYFSAKGEDAFVAWDYGGTSWRLVDSLAPAAPKPSADAEPPVAKFAVRERVAIRQRSGAFEGTVESVSTTIAHEYKIVSDAGRCSTFDESLLSPAAPKPSADAEPPVAKFAVGDEVGVESTLFGYFIGNIDRIRYHVTGSGKFSGTYGEDKLIANPKGDGPKSHKPSS